MDPVMARISLKVKIRFKKETSYKQTFKFSHDLQGHRAFYLFYQEVDQAARQSPAVIFKSTGYYHEPIIQFIDNHVITYYLINPLVSY
ncbi:hypothetical protein [Virgibacillus ndiopensis]|uniref:hypothetical protein n=1 Tax=Virgibacillus ndiopensis TaxID=2004408 RepID=UPI000C0817F2|nr:hypothetical protein [Virgibacillus ndiopensis]